MTATRTRSRGERGVAIIITALCLIPLMTFAAFGVDLASWYSRASFLQKSADAAALAGTVWMPNLGKSTTIACDSLLANGIDGGDCGTGPYDVEVDRGSTATSLRVTVTDPNATRYFSQVFSSGNQSLSRSAEAEYNLPIPLGSPLNYFGGDATRTVPPTPPDEYALNWPTNGNSSTRPPALPQVGDTAQAYGCNVGTLSAQGYGRWTNPGNPNPPVPSYNPTGFSGSTRCNYSVTFTLPGGTTNVPPPDYTRRAPTNAPCNVFHGTTTNGRWQTGPVVFSGSARYTSGSGNKQCTWAVAQSSDVPSFYNGTNIPPGSAPVNRPCRVGYETSQGWWGPNATSGWSATGAPTGTQALGNRLCRWPAAITTTTPPTPPNPIASTRSPGFWAQIEGPSTIATNGDIYSTRCYTTANCGSDQNVQYQDPANPDRGYWYVVKAPAVAVGSIDINVFDASHNTNGSVDVLAGDRSFTSNSTYPTDFKVYQQTNPLDFSVRSPVFISTTGDEADGSCNWRVNGGTATAFRGTWRRLCTITSPTPGGTYLINVQTPGTTGNGVNGYALEAVTGGSHSNANQPALYAYANMGMYNNNRCEPTGSCTPPPATFYLAEVGPQFAGRTLVVDLWDPGDVSDGNASMYPKMPSTSAPKPVQNVPAAGCTYTSSPAPNPVQSGGDPTGAVYTTPQSSDDATRCGITTATGGARRFNGTWVTIRIDIPTTYTCTPNSPSTPINPEVDANSCWWGIEYIFSESSQDVTTWQARIEGNPVHLTQ